MRTSVLWGKIVRFSTTPLPGRTVRVTQNVVVLDSNLAERVVETKDVRVRCDVYYSRGWTKLVRKLTVPGAWRPPHLAENDYGGVLTGEVRCGPWKVRPKTLGLWLGINPRVTYRGSTFDLARGKGLKGRLIRAQIRKPPPGRKPPPAPPVPTSFLPRVPGGSLYPQLRDVPFGGTMGAIWQAFGRPPASTCAANACHWVTSVDSFSVEPTDPFDGSAAAGRRFRRVVLSTKDVTKSKLGGWQTPEGIHIGSTAADVRRAYPTAGCEGVDRECQLEVLRPLDGARYRFRLFITLNGRASNAQTRVVSLGVMQLGAEEGSCRPRVSFSSQGTGRNNFLVEVECSGKLKTARLEALDGSTRLGEAPTNQRGRPEPAVYTDAGTPGEQNAGRPYSDEEFAGGAYTWRIGCMVPEEFDPARCAPGRGPAPYTWDPSLYEHWELFFRGTSSVPSVTQNNKERIPPLRFVAEFADRPTFTYILREAY